MKIFLIFFSVFFIFSIVTCTTNGDQTNTNGTNSNFDDVVLPSNFPGNITGALPDNEAMKFVRDMGIAINIGNTLDAIGSNSWHAGENGWGNPNITQSFIKALKNYGYKSIRLPVTWAEYIGAAPDYTIGKCVFNCGNCPNRMDRAAEVVKWILDEDMYCIINLHHDGGHSDKSWILNASKNFDTAKDQFIKIWKQIAVRFAGASDKLIFESMNEVGFDDVWGQWGGGSGTKKQAFDLLNALNQTFVDTVRGVQGNEDRFLLIAGYWTNIGHSCDPLFKMPEDTIDHRLILSVHYYDPSTFCIAEERNNSWGFRDSWGTASDYNHLKNEYDKLKTNYLDKGIPVIMGEYGVAFKNKIESSRVEWMAAVTQISLNYGICPVLWDTGGEINRRSPYVMRNTLKRVWEIVE